MTRQQQFVSLALRKPWERPVALCFVALTLGQSSSPPPQARLPEESARPASELDLKHIYGDWLRKAKKDPQICAMPLETLRQNATTRGMNFEVISPTTTKISGGEGNNEVVFLPRIETGEGAGSLDVKTSMRRLWEFERKRISDNFMRNILGALEVEVHTKQPGRGLQLIPA